MNTEYLKQFTHGYIECALWSTGDDECESFLDAGYDESDLPAELLAEMRSDCEDFVSSNSALLAQSGLQADYAGHDFWLTREGHGDGFWDRGLGVIGEKLTAASKVYGSFELWVQK